jgi:UDP-N-acetyl-2-amino-2-deoxyglucuronate dehydrogenase
MVRVALVGCGRISKSHVEALAGLTDAELVACCDVVPARAEAIASKTDCAAYSDYERMLRETKCDVVSLCTPSGLHPSQAALAAKYGRHVLSEKPLGVRLDDVDEAIRACDAAGVHLFVVKQNRFNRTVRLARQALEMGRFGRIYMVLSSVLWARPQEYYDAARWRGTWEYDGGCLCNQAAHYVDLVQWMGGAVESVQAYSATQGRRIEAEDSIVVNLRFRSGALGSINVTTLAYPKNLEGSLTILGEKGTVKIGGFALNHFERWEFDSGHPMDEEIQSAATNPPNVYGFGHLDYYRHVLDVLNGQGEAEVDGRDGRKTVELICAAYVSARKGGTPCPLPLVAASPF